MSNTGFPSFLLFGVWRRLRHTHLTQLTRIRDSRNDATVTETLPKGYKNGYLGIDVHTRVQQAQQAYTRTARSGPQLNV
jgi:hypothetical protein